MVEQIIEMDEEGKEVSKRESKVFSRKRVDSTLKLDQHPFYEEKRSETQKNLTSMYAM